MKEREKVLYYLNEEFTEPVRDPIWKNIYLSKPLEKIVSSLEFQKLHGIKQLGPAYLVYPGATHTRFNHSIGVFHLAKRIITKLLLKQAEISYTLDDVKAFLCAALLHDLGHFPFAHSLKDLDIKHHETLTGEIILKGKLSALIKNHLSIEPYRVSAIIDTGLEIKQYTGIPFFRHLLSGVLDPDKLDYLNRDAYFCGVPYGIQDIDFIINELHPVKGKGVAISQKGLASIESILFSKYLMYRNVYWHKKVRIITAMIKKSILMGLKAGKIKAGDLYFIDDNEFFTKMRSIRFSPFQVIDSAIKKQLYISIGEIPFMQNNSFHKKIEDLHQRLEFEDDIAKKLSEIIGRNVDSEEIIIEVPEPITFEIDVPIIRGEEKVPFPSSGSVFSEQVINGFCRSLRHVSLLIPPKEDIINAVSRLKPLSLLKGHSFQTKG